MTGAAAWGAPCTIGLTCGTAGVRGAAGTWGTSSGSAARLSGCATGVWGAAGTRGVSSASEASPSDGPASAGVLVVGWTPSAWALVGADCGASPSGPVGGSTAGGTGRAASGSAARARA